MSSVLRFDEWQDSEGNPVASGVGGAFSAPGSVLQVVSTTKTDTFTTSSTSFVDVTGLSVSITPKSATSKILLLGSVNLGGLGASNAAALCRFGGGNASVVGDSAGNRIPTFNAFSARDGSQRAINIYQMYQATPVLLDSPATTSLINYTLQLRSLGGAVYVNQAGTDTNSGDVYRGVSTITVMEVAG